MAKELSEGVRGEIMALIKEGLSHRQIAARMRVSKGAVQRTAERFKRTNAYSTLPRSGRPKCTTPQQDRFIKITSLRIIEERLRVICRLWLMQLEGKQSAKQQ